MNGLTRTKLALTENNPVIKPYDENAWAALGDMRLPIDISLGIIDGIHARWAAVFRSMSDAQFARTMVHPERGRDDDAGVPAARLRLAFVASPRPHHAACASGRGGKMAAGQKKDPLWPKTKHPRLRSATRSA